MHQQLHAEFGNACDVHPRSRASEKPNPGSDGTITSNESAASPPWRAGSTSGGMILSMWANELGQPWVMISGSGRGPWPRSWMKCRPTPSTSARYWANRLSASSWARQSKSVPPVGHQALEVGQVGAVVPAGVRKLVRPAYPCQAVLEVVNGRLGDVDRKRLQRHGILPRITCWVQRSSAIGIISRVSCSTFMVPQ